MTFFLVVFESVGDDNITKREPRKSMNGMAHRQWAVETLESCTQILLAVLNNLTHDTDWLGRHPFLYVNATERLNEMRRFVVSSSRAVSAILAEFRSHGPGSAAKSLGEGGGTVGSSVHQKSTPR